MKLINNLVVRGLFILIGHVIFSSTVSAQFVSNPLSRAVDNTAYNFVKDPDPEIPSFVPQTVFSTYDGDALQSPPINASEIAGFQVFIPTSTSVSFDWKVSSEDGYDELIFAIQDSSGEVRIIKRISGEKDWSTVTYFIPNGNVTLGWAYLKDSGVTEGSDTAWVDNIRIGISGEEDEGDDEGEENEGEPLEPAQFIPAILNILLNEN